jgi:DNA-binding NtrC family response regulator
MTKVQILVIGRNAEILRILHRLINSNDAWLGYTALNDEDAISIFSNHSIDLVLLSSGIPSSSEAYIRQEFINRQPEIHIVQHYGGGSGLLYNEIEAVLHQVKGGKIEVRQNAIL